MNSAPPGEGACTPAVTARFLPRPESAPVKKYVPLVIKRDGGQREQPRSV